MIASSQASVGNRGESEEKAKGGRGLRAVRQLEKGRECVDWLCCRFSSLSRVLNAAHQASFIFMY